MNRALLFLTLSGTALLPVHESIACYGALTTTESAADTAAREEAASGAMTTWSVGTLASISSEVRVLAPDTPAGEHATNVIYGILPAIDRGFDTVGVAWARDTKVTVQLTSTAAPIWPDGSSTTAWTSCGRRDCDILLFREAWAGDQYLTYVLAHEFAHVAQQLIYPAVDDNATGWWGEGTAEWFANVVVPGRNFSAYWIGAFDARSHHTALTDMCYEAATFFFWAGAEFGMDYPFSLAGHGEAALSRRRDGRQSVAAKCMARLR